MKGRFITLYMAVVLHCIIWQLWVWHATNSLSTKIHPALLKVWHFTLFSLFYITEKKSRLSLIRNVFNWLNILFPDFPRDQIRAAGEITSRIQLTLTYLGLMRENRGGGVQKKILLAACLPGVLSLIALLLMKSWCNYKKEALFHFLLMRVMLVWAQTGFMKSQNTHSAPAPCLSSILTVCLHCMLHVTLYSHPSPSTMWHWQERAARSPELVHSCLHRRVGDLVIICWFLWAAVVLRGLLSSYSLPGLEWV